MFSGCVFRTLKNAQRFCVAHAQEQLSPVELSLEGECFQGAFSGP